MIVKEAVANGRLAPGSDDHSPGVTGAAVLADRAGIPLDQLAIAAALAQPWARWVLSGAVADYHLVSNLAAGSLSPDADLLAELREVAEPARDYWADRSARPWR